MSPYDSEVYYLKGDGKDELDQLGHRIVFDRDGHSLNIPGITADPADLELCKASVL